MVLQGSGVVLFNRSMEAPIKVEAFTGAGLTEAPPDPSDLRPEEESVRTWTHQNQPLLEGSFKHTRSSVPGHKRLQRLRTFQRSVIIDWLIDTKGSVVAMATRSETDQSKRRRSSGDEEEMLSEHR